MPKHYWLTAVALLALGSPVRSAHAEQFELTVGGGVRVADVVETAAVDDDGTFSAGTLSAGARLPIAPWGLAVWTTLEWENATLQSTVFGNFDTELASDTIRAALRVRGDLVGRVGWFGRALAGYQTAELELDVGGSNAVRDRAHGFALGIGAGFEVHALTTPYADLRLRLGIDYTVAPALEFDASSQGESGDEILIDSDSAALGRIDLSGPLAYGRLVVAF